MRTPMWVLIFFPVWPVICVDTDKLTSRQSPRGREVAEIESSANSEV